MKMGGERWGEEGEGEAFQSAVDVVQRQGEVSLVPRGNPRTLGSAPRLPFLSWIYVPSHAFVFSRLSSPCFACFFVFLFASFSSVSLFPFHHSSVDPTACSRVCYYFVYICMYVCLYAVWCVCVCVCVMRVCTEHSYTRPVLPFLSLGLCLMPLLPQSPIPPPPPPHSA